MTALEPNVLTGAVVATAIDGAISRLTWLIEGPLPAEEHQVALDLIHDLQAWKAKFVFRKDL
jgi:hypothetical protein